ncbi:MAG: BON domain-containing protein [Candidatus Azobacteroides sp.]|nr:BON domain-containing protein [Candidatus Azobacteroides sp.]
MKTKLLSLCAVVLFAAIAFSSCKPSDEQLQKQVTAGITAVSSAISSDVKKGEVTLSGVVNSDDLKAAAEIAAKAVKGVKSVVNNIQVQLPAPVITPDQALQTAVSTAVAAGGDAFNQVVVAVQDSVITLTGDIKKADLQKVMQIVSGLQPKKVVNSLTIAK